jgi:diacylglycerol kinase family enzyme
MKAIALVNRHAGAVDHAAKEPTTESIRDALEAVGVDADVRTISADSLAAQARAAANEPVDAVIAAGGDGTLSAVASALAGGDTPLGVIPAGTLNHFAKDLGIPTTLADAAQTIAAQYIEHIDLGRVNDRIFLNNASLGVYARALIDRDARRDLHGLSKWPAMALAVLKVFKRHPLLKVRIVADGEPMFRKTPLVFVGNNRYELELLRIGRRACLTAGELSLYIANTSTRWGMLKLALRAAFGRLEQSRDFQSMCTSEIEIHPRRRHIHLALDGEPTNLAPPLTFTTWPQALPVIVPAPKDSSVPLPSAGREHRARSPVGTERRWYPSRSD